MNVTRIKRNFNCTVWFIDVLAVPESTFPDKSFKFSKSIHNLFGVKIIQLKLSNTGRVNQVSTTRNVIDCGIGCGVLSSFSFRRYFINTNFQIRD